MKVYKDRLALAYAAGLIDGEACIGVYKNTHYGSYQLRVAVEMTTDEGLEVLFDLFGGREYRKEQTSTRKARKIWMVFGSRAEAALTELRPFLRVKAKLVAVALEADWSGFVGRPLSERERETRRRVCSTLHAMNQKGPRC